ncbi:MAG: hypothetical protein ACUVRX_08445 [Actinomycetota bacterium]
MVRPRGREGGEGEGYPPTLPEKVGRARVGVELRRAAYPLFSLLCLLWLILRSGRKPSRLRYPCQQAAMVHSGWILSLGGAFLVRALGARTPRRKWVMFPIIFLLALLSLLDWAG